MATIEFKTLKFIEEKDKIKVVLYGHFYFYADKEDIKNINKDYRINPHSITIKNISEEKAMNKFNFIISNNIKGLKSQITNKKAAYIHRNSGVPLIGNSSFGIVDRNTNLIEIKPITGCNLNCIFCSVDESKREVDFVVEEDYLIEELKKLIAIKECDDIEIHINTHGEPLLYSEIVNLVKDCAEIKEVKRISMDTNGTLLNKELIHKLRKAGMTQINLSLNAISPEKAKELAGAAYNVEGVLGLAEEITRNMALVIAPVWVPGVNDDELEKIIVFGKGLMKKHPQSKIRVGIQNFLSYKYGKKPAKQAQWDVFFGILRKLEEKHSVKLIFSENDFNIKKTAPLQKPFKKGDVVKADVLMSGRLKDEMIAVAGSRTISVPKCRKKGIVKLKITRSKHNIFVGVVVR